MKLGLGTVQFGLDYGITNAQGRPDLTSIRAMLADAAGADVLTLDTAALYGDAESVLGQTLPRPHGFQIVSKTQPQTAPTPEGLLAETRASLSRLGEAQLAGLLVHRPDDLLGPHGDALWRALEAVKAAGLTRAIGVSVYTPAETLTLAGRYPLDLVQLPCNVLDQRPLNAGSLATLAEKGVRVHVRSAFLQGLLLAPADFAGVPPGLAPALAAWRQQVAELGLSPLAAVFGFFKGLAAQASALDTLLCGATGPEEWQAILDAWATAPTLAPETFKNLAVRDDKLIDPRQWPRL